MWTCTKVDEVTVLIARNFLSFWDLVDEVELESADIPRTFRLTTQPTTFCHLLGFLAADDMSA